MPTFSYNGPDGAIQAVEGEPWFWIAHYRDGACLPQFCAETRTFHRFDEIDLGRLTAFEVRNAFDEARAFRIRIAPGMRPIFFKRHMRLNVGTPQEQHVILFCFGYQETVGGRNVKCVLTIGKGGAVSIENHDGRA